VSEYFTLFIPIQDAAAFIISVAQRTQGRALDVFRFGIPEDAQHAQTLSGSQHIHLCFIHETGNQVDQKFRTVILDLFRSWLEEQGFSANPHKGSPTEQDYPLQVEEFWLYILFNIGQPQPNLKIEDQLLAIIPVEDDDLLGAVITKFAASATFTRVAVTENPSGRRLAFFYVKDDQSRGSSFKSVVESGHFPYFECLTEFTDGESSVFLPAGLNIHDRLLLPGSTGLHLFCQFLRSSPNLWGNKASNTIDHNLLAAVLPKNMETKDAGQGWCVYDLRSLDFLDQSQLVFRADDYQSVEIISYKDNISVSGEDLRRAIQQAEPLIGRRLYLQDTKLRLHFTETIDLARSDQEVASLVDQINNLQYRLALLQSISVRKPLLLRFTHKQLPALADYLRTLSPKRLADGVLQYAFHATENNPQGFHYLFLAPDILAEADITPLYSWPDLEEKRVFWLDPFWARYYPDSSERCYVFVPYQQALFPSMHSWDDQDMDEYLRSVMKEWASQEQEEVAIPDLPLYIFDPIHQYGNEGDTFQEMRVFVLDMKAFQNIRVNLPWINDNLVLHHEISTGETIRALADAKTRVALVNNQLEKQKEIFVRLNQSAQSIKQHLDNLITNLAETISAQLTRINTSTIDTAEKARQLNNRLRAIEVEYQLLNAMIEKMKAGQDEFKTTAEKKVSEAIDVHQKVLNAVNQSAQVRDQMELQTSATIQNLETSEKHQRQRLENIHFWRR
jgi:hypothetical protein